MKEKMKFNYGNVRRIPDNLSGVYAFWVFPEAISVWRCLYIGKADVCLKKRLKNHWDREPSVGKDFIDDREVYSDDLYFCYYSRSYLDKQKVHNLESMLIKKWGPDSNTVKKIKKLKYNRK